jgi:hypothetical protein
LLHSFFKESCIFAGTAKVELPVSMIAGKLYSKTLLSSLVPYNSFYPSSAQLFDVFPINSGMYPNVFIV